MDAGKDIAFEIGRFYYGIREYSHALKFYKISSDTIGGHHVTFHIHNQGLCHYSIGEIEIALVQFKKALSMNNEYEKARCWVEKCMKELEKVPVPDSLVVNSHEETSISR